MALLSHANIATSSQNENAVVAAVAGKRVKVYKFVIVNGAATAQTITIKDKASGSTLATLYLPSSIGGGLVLGNGSTSECPVFMSVDGGAFIVNLSAATAVGGFVQYTQE